jgi:hypothetical protein
MKKLTDYSFKFNNNKEEKNITTEEINKDDKEKKEKIELKKSIIFNEKEINNFKIFCQDILSIEEINIYEQNLLRRVYFKSVSNYYFFLEKEKNYLQNIEKLKKELIEIKNENNKQKEEIIYLNKVN